jgi:glycosyltransferase involved in cell wall biosynthesis
MASGCPVVATNISGAEDMVRDGSEGLVIPTDSPEDLADAISRVLSDFELTKTLGRNGRDRVEAKYDWRRIGEEYVSVYEEIAQ